MSELKRGYEMACNFRQVLDDFSKGIISWEKVVEYSRVTGVDKLDDTFKILLGD